MGSKRVKAQLLMVYLMERKCRVSLQFPSSCEAPLYAFLIASRRYVDDSVRSSPGNKSCFRKYTYIGTNRKEQSVRPVDYLTQSSRMICTDSGCTGENHHCCMFAFINRSMRILDVCAPDAFRGGEAHAVIPLPWYGSQQELEKEVAAQCAAWSRYFGHDG
jgi:hypothetical protein